MKKNQYVINLLNVEIRELNDLIRDAKRACGNYKIIDGLIKEYENRKIQCMDVLKLINKSK